MEIKLSQLAMTNSTSEKVKQFASTMQEDHTKASKALKKMAEEKKIFLPTQLSDKSQKVYESLSKKTGDDFDKAYMSCMVKDHKHDICEFEHEAKKGKDADVKKWASDEVPTLKKHLDLAQSTCDDVKKKK
jgi:putative membrane protein